MTETKLRLRFRRQPSEQGLARVCQGPRGYELWYGDQRIGMAAPIVESYRSTGTFYWYCGSNPDLGITYRNTASCPVGSMEEAKAALRAYVEDCLKRAGLR